MEGRSIADIAKEQGKDGVDTFLDLVLADNLQCELTMASWNTREDRMRELLNNKSILMALGDGGALMGISELETAVRLGLGLLVVVYNDDAYGAEVHHFGPHGQPLDHVLFPETDIAAIGRGFGCAGITVRTADDLAPVADWLAGPRDRPLVVDAKVTRGQPSWWLEEAFRGH